MPLCPKCGTWIPDAQDHRSASALIVELMDARGEAAKYKDLFERMKTTYDEMNALHDAMTRLENSKARETGTAPAGNSRM
jgi:hypothetical protein